MVYSNKFVLAVLRNGTPQKELANGVVKIPFGEYALRFRNKNNRRAVVKFFIDGENVSGLGYIVPANGHVDIERHHDTPKKFNFVSLESPEAVDFGKNGPNEDKVKGTIEARFYMEKEQPSFSIQTTPEIHHHHHHYSKPQPWIHPQPIWPILHDQGPICGGGGRTMGLAPMGGSMEPAMLSGTTMYRRKLTSCDSNISSASGIESICNTAPVQDGCTVEGTHSSQTFRTISFEAETDYVSLKVFLQGYDEEVVSSLKPVKESEEERLIRQMMKEKVQLQQQLEEKRLRNERNAMIRELAEENKKLREQLGI